MGKSPKFILAQTRIVHLKWGCTDTLEAVLYCTATWIVPATISVFLFKLEHACAIFTVSKGREFTHLESHTNYCSSNFPYFCIFCDEIFCFFSLCKVCLVLSFTGISNQMKDWRHSTDSPNAVAKERSCYSKEQNIRDNKIIFGSNDKTCTLRNFYGVFVKNVTMLSNTYTFRGKQARGFFPSYLN